VLEPSPGAHNDGLHSSTSFPDFELGSGDSASQTLDTEEATVEEAAPALPAGQAALSAETKVLPQTAQKPSASSLAGQAGESTQASLVPVAQAATPTLDEQLSAARAKAETTTRRLSGLVSWRLALERRVSSNPELSKAYPEGHLEQVAQQIELYSQKRESELSELRELEAEQARSQSNMQDDAD